MSCLLSPVSCVLSPVSCVLSPVSCLLSSVSCLLSPVSCLLCPVSCLLCPVSCLLSPVSCLLSPVSCLLSLVSCLLSLYIKVILFSQLFGKLGILLFSLILGHAFLGIPCIPLRFSLKIKHTRPCGVDVPHGSLLVQGVDLLEFVIAHCLVYLVVHLMNSLQEIFLQSHGDEGLYRCLTNLL